MKKLGLWMMAAILLCGSVATFVACNGNSLDDIIGNVDNTDNKDNTGNENNTGDVNNGASNNEDVKKWLLESLTDGAVFKIEYIDGVQTVSIKLKYDADHNEFSKIDDLSVSNIHPTIKYNKETGLITACFICRGISDIIDLFGVIFNAQTNEYSKVNINATYDFKSIILCNGDDEIDLTEKLTDACPEKATIVCEYWGNKYSEFFVYYSIGDTWQDINERYEAVSSTYDIFNSGRSTDPVTINWGRNQVYGIYYNGSNTQALYGDKVGKYGSDNIDTYEMKQ